MTLGTFVLFVLLVVMGIAAWTARAEGEIREWKKETESWADQDKQ